jgi:lysophospholipase L1-like esterase
MWTPQEMMGAFMKQNGINCLAVDFSEFEEDSLKKLYLYADGMHFSALGHHLIAEQIITYLEKAASRKHTP